MLEGIPYTMAHFKPELFKFLFLFNNMEFVQNCTHHKNQSPRCWTLASKRIVMLKSEEH